jgi:cytoskeleton protein RodZ
VLSPTPLAAVVASTPAIAPPVAAPAPVAAASQAMPAGIVTFRAKGESWVEVTDAKGTVVLRRTLTAGEVAGASGALPLAAVVGKADLTQVQVRGQAFDLNAVARDNVARFEVK